MICLITSVQAAMGDIFSWIDENGGLNLTSTRPPKSAKGIKILDANAPGSPRVPQKDGKFYSWVDQDGGLNLTSTRPPKLATEIKVLGSNFVRQKNASLTGLTKEKPARVPSSAEAKDKGKTQKHKVELFVTSWCPYCHKAKALLDKHRIPYIEYDIEKDAKAKRRKDSLDKKTGVPFAIINGKHLHGYSERAYLSALNM